MLNQTETGSVNQQTIWIVAIAIGLILAMVIGILVFNSSDNSDQTDQIDQTDQVNQIDQNPETQISNNSNVTEPQTPEDINDSTSNNSYNNDNAVVSNENPNYQYEVEVIDVNYNATSKKLAITSSITSNQDLSKIDSCKLDFTEIVDEQTVSSTTSEGQTICSFTDLDISNFPENTEGPDVPVLRITAMEGSKIRGIYEQRIFTTDNLNLDSLKI